MIDLHCHILPGVDDGPSGPEESLAMAERAAADGIEVVVATPHAFNGVYEISPCEITRHVSRLRELLQQNRIALKICPGAEIHLHNDIAGSIQAGYAATLNATGRYVLVELPMQAVPGGCREQFFRLRLGGVTPIVAHAERNAVFQNEPEVLADLVSMGALVQITAMSVTGELGREAMESAHTLLRRRLGHVLATDAHSVEGRPPLLSQAVEAAADVMGSVEEARAMVWERPRAILAGEALVVPDPRKPRRRRFFFWRT